MSHVLPLKYLVLTNLWIQLILSTRSKCVCIVCVRSYIQVSFLKYMSHLFFTLWLLWTNSEETVFHISECFNNLIMQQNPCVSPQYVIFWKIRWIQMYWDRFWMSTLSKLSGINKTNLSTYDTFLKSSGCLLCASEGKYRCYNHTLMKHDLPFFQDWW